jgi:predicted RNase H-like nuclease
VLDQPNHQGAIKMCEVHGRAKVSAQAYALRERIFEAERVAELDGRVYQVHPEVCFCEMAGEPLQHSKRTWSGFKERFELLERNGITIPSALGAAGAAAPTMSSMPPRRGRPPHR